jgi:tyrosinase
LTDQQADSAQPAGVPGVRLRKSAATLTDADLAGLRAALIAMQGISDDRGYQHYAGIHGLPLPGYCVHHDAAGILGNLQVGPLFLPWHRAYLYFFELALQDAGQDTAVSLPWWDWATDPGQASQIPAAYAVESANGQPNPLFHGPITAIPDSQWQGVRQSLSQDTGTDPGPLPAVTFRQPGTLSAAPPGLPSPKEVTAALSAPNFVDFSQRVERIHDGVHVWVGGTMSEIPIAAYDPLFYVHHTMIDRLWWLWQLQHPGAGPPAQYLNAPLPPFPSLTVGGTLDINSLGYEYALAEVPLQPAAQGQG